MMLLLWQVALRLSYHVAAAGLCLGGSDILAAVRENSPTGRLVSTLSIGVEPGDKAVRLCLSGDDADWFYLERRTVRLNVSAPRVLDREVLGAVLIAELTCSEHNVLQSHSRILVEILNENDNRPDFLPETVRPLAVSELTPVDSVVFAVKAVDADGDMISYIIDPSSPDAWFFRIDLPNSGKVVLDKPLDYETRRQLQVNIWAQEANTPEEFNTSAVLTVDIEDGDDQYPHFLPCTPVTPGVPVCLSPAYTANVTHKQQDAVLEFSPGPIRAEDGDRGINTPLLYSILSGEDHGRFGINNRTGELRLTRPVSKRQLMTNFTLVVMVCQENDRLKYSVASVLVRVLSQNLHPPVFNRTIYKGFVIQSPSPASIISTYGNQVLQVQVSDQDFSDGRNLNIHYLLHPPSGLYQVTQQGVLIARADQLHALDRHILQVVARDVESGEEVSASVDIEVLQRGQPGDDGNETPANTQPSPPTDIPTWYDPTRRGTDQTGLKFEARGEAFGVRAPRRDPRGPGSESRPSGSRLRGEAFGVRAPRRDLRGPGSKARPSGSRLRGEAFGVRAPRRGLRGPGSEARPSGSRLRGEAFGVRAPRRGLRGPGSEAKPSGSRLRGEAFGVRAPRRGPWGPGSEARPSGTQYQTSSARQVTSSRPEFSSDEASHTNKAFGHDEPSGSRPGLYTRRPSQLPPPSSSSSPNIIISDPDGRSRPRSDLVPVVEKPEACEARRLSDVTEGGGSRGHR
ncbi:cadherin-related family member 5 [Brachionichthys hirsutus]|uniref:cadherin-related family member 5 n=1 Tax=Brachionichthys hirsutus TaxID=412623 RepID=UPI0036054559